MYWEELITQLWNTSLFGANYWATIVLAVIIILWLVVPSILGKYKHWWSESTKQAKNQWLRFPYRLAIAIVLISCFLFWGQYQVYDDMKTSLQEEQVNLQQQIDDLQDRLSAFTKLEYLSPALEDQRVKSPNSTDITITVRGNFDPDYQGTIKQEIHNPDEYNHIFEIVRFKVESSLPKYASEILFTTIDKSLIPPNVVILSDYQGTKYIIAIINDIPPGRSIEFNFPIYAMEASEDIKDTAQLTYEILDSKVIQ